MVGAEFVPEHPAEFPAEAAGYGDVPLEVKGCRFAEMHLRVETLIGADVPGTLVELMATPAET